MPPVLPTERIAHLGTADCCIHPPGRNEMIAITPPKIFSKEVAQNRPPHFCARASSPLEIVSDQISGDGAWMNFRFSRALPQGGSLTPGREAFGCRAGPLNLPRPGRTTYLARPRRRRLRCRRPRKGGRHAV